MGRRCLPGVPGKLRLAGIIDAGDVRSPALGFTCTQPHISRTGPSRPGRAGQDTSGGQTETADPHKTHHERQASKARGRRLHAQ